MKFLIFLVINCGAFIACNYTDTKEPTLNDLQGVTTLENSTVTHFRGALTGGMKGDSIFFDVNASNTRLQNLTFKGYWRCGGKLERENAAGPTGSFTLVNGKVNDHISDPPDGGSSDRHRNRLGWRSTPVCP